MYFTDIHLGHSPADRELDPKAGVHITYIHLPVPGILGAGVARKSSPGPSGVEIVPDEGKKVDGESPGEVLVDGEDPGEVPVDGKGPGEVSVDGEDQGKPHMTVEVGISTLEQRYTSEGQKFTEKKGQIKMCMCEPQMMVHDNVPEHR